MKLFRETNRNGISKRLLALFSAGIMLFSAACSSGGGASVSSELNSARSVLFVKDGQLQYVMLDQKEMKPIELTEDLFEEPQEGFYVDASVHALSNISPDGKKILYVDEIKEDQWNGILYYRELTADGVSEAKKIAKDVMYYEVNDDFTLITYTSSKDSALYQYDLVKGEKTKIDKEVYGNFSTSSDGKRIVYGRDDKGIYELESGGEKKRFANSGYLIHASKDLSEFYYIEDDVLYKKAFGQEPEEIDDLHMYVQVYETGEIYYIKSEKAKLDWSELFEDDMLESDKKLEYIASPSYPQTFDYATEEAFNKALEKYNADLEKYNKFSEMTIRDELRHKLEKNEIEYDVYSLYYYDGKETVKVKDSIVWESLFADRPTGDLERADVPTLGFLSYADSDKAPVPLSEVFGDETYIYDLQSLLSIILQFHSDRYLAINGKASDPIESFRPSTYGMPFNSVIVSRDGSKVYLQDADPEANFSFKRLEIQNGKIGEPEDYLEGVNMYRMLPNGELIYAINDDSDKYEVFFNENESLENAWIPYGNDYNDKKNTMILASDMSEDYPAEYTLSFYDFKSLEEISDSVYDSLLLTSGDVVYLKDYDEQDGGDLYLYVPGGDDIKIADEVAGIVDPRLGWENFAG